ncbi:hypothetical protein ACKLKD_07080 [Klebsiella sp. 10982]|uniref:Type 1 fimbrial protein n=1 Tax=Klebsiella quasivariicola TaxID=2026240 RepID=A0A223UC05_9ENTR|nr:MULTISPECIES: hypothetical protein [Klebsiella]MEA1148715.1 hypothetical protein [Klebsiella pneumoniae]QBL49510.1 hypothetical protein BMD99_013775 [Klebsiella sp. PO552]ASV20327.1 hypothetical protein B8P98_14060 [Klebsiella quasivariicola]MBF7818318.1 hypothetical protein [Klebsiella quasivariicola]MBK2370898.1 hypothetical protein [Klebsiella quasivariicola]
MSPSRLALLCLCLAPLASSAALSGQVHFSGHVINPACLITPQRDRIAVSCQHRSPQQVAVTGHRPRYAMPDNRGEVSIHWRNAQHSEADVIIRYR